MSKEYAKDCVNHIFHHMVNLTIGTTPNGVKVEDTSKLEWLILRSSKFQ